MWAGIGLPTNHTFFLLTYDGSHMPTAALLKVKAEDKKEYAEQ